jgi:hypothetical protein
MGPVGTPLKDTSLERAEHFVGSGALGSRKVGHLDDAANHPWAAPEAAGDLDLAHALLGEMAHPTFDGSQRDFLIHTVLLRWSCCDLEGEW